MWAESGETSAALAHLKDATVSYLCTPSALVHLPNNAVPHSGIGCRKAAESVEFTGTVPK